MHTLAILGVIAALIILGLILWRNTCPMKHVIKGNNTVQYVGL